MALTQSTLLAAALVVGMGCVAAGAPGLHQEVLTWHPVTPATMPDAELTVLMAWPRDTSEGDLPGPFEPEGGWYDGEAWHYIESGGVVTTPPSWWANWPDGPAA